MEARTSSNYKKYHSTVLLAVSDAMYRFTMVCGGVPGNCSDAGIFAESSIAEGFATGGFNLPVGSDWHLVGDEGFPLKPFLLRPFPERGLDHRKKVFNLRLSRARRVVENAFGVMAARWRILHRPIAGDEELRNGIVQAAVCLHNFLMGNNHYRHPEFIDREDREGNVTRGEWRTVAGELRLQADGEQLCIG